MVDTTTSRRSSWLSLALSRSGILAAALVLLILLTLSLRLWSLNRVPPWLWWDEATQGLDARDLLHGHFQVFFPRAQGKEPLFIYLTTPFVAAWDGQPFATRLAGALLGGLMVPGLYVAGRALAWRRPEAGSWLGLAAAGFWATSFWAQSINRIGFQVNALPLMLTLAVVTWLNWTRRPTRGRAATFGLMAGLTLATYLAARITPLLWLLLYLTLPRRERRALHPTLPWAALAFALVAGPLLVFFLLQPQEALGRVSAFANLYQAPTWRDQALLLLDSARSVAGGFLGFAGDPIPRHNIPNRPPFSPALAALFGLGLLLALASLVLRPRAGRANAAGLAERPGRTAGPRAAIGALVLDRQAGWTLLAWWATICVPAALSANSNPHFPRLLGALPAGLLLAAWPVAWLAGRARAWAGGRWLLALLLAGLLVVEGAGMARAYFVTWSRDTDLYTWYQGDMWSIGEEVARRPGTSAVIPADPDSADGLAYAFAGLPISHVVAGEDTLPAWLADQLGGAGGQRVLTVDWQIEPYVYADPKALVPFYLAREGTAVEEKTLRGYTLHTYTLGPRPQFAAAGQQTVVAQPFARGLALESARWGAAYPNPDRSDGRVAAGTAAWVELTWRMPEPLEGLRVALDVVDGQGHRVASADVPLMDEWSRPRRWDAGQPWRTYHLVTVPATQPPGPVALEARVYEAESRAPVVPEAGTPRLSVPVAAPAVTAALRPVAAAEVDVPRPAAHRVSGSLALLGTGEVPASAAPGQALALPLYWQALGEGYSQAAPVVALGDVVSASLALPAGVPAGSAFQTYADLRLPAAAPAGTFPLRLTTGPGGAEIALGEVAVAGRPRRFDAAPPDHPYPATFGDAVRLLGYAAPPDELRVRAGQAFTITLTWQPLRTPEAGLVRFVHVLGPDRRPVAQSDAAPCGGECPAASWLAGEVLVDQVRVEVPADVAPGTYPLGTGWFDATSRGRLVATDGAGARAVDDLLLLPLTVTIEPEGDG